LLLADRYSRRACQNCLDCLCRFSIPNW